MREKIEENKSIETIDTKKEYNKQELQKMFDGAKKQFATVLGDMFNNATHEEFLTFLRAEIKNNPKISFNIVADFVDKSKLRQAKALIERSTSENEIKIAIRATRKQMETEVNVFNSGVEWIEIKDAEREI